MTTLIAPRRPLSALLPGYLLILVAVLAVLDGFVGTIPMGALGQATNDAYAEHGAWAASAQLGEAVQADVLVALAIAVVLGGAYLMLGLHRVFDFGARRAARVATWVLAGIGAFCFGYGFFGPASGSLVTRSADLVPPGLDTELIKRQIAAHTPGWVAPAQTTFAVVILVLLAAAVVMITLPSSSAYIRARR